MSIIKVDYGDVGAGSSINYFVADCLAIGSASTNGFYYQILEDDNIQIGKFESASSSYTQIYDCDAFTILGTVSVMKIVAKKDLTLYKATGYLTGVLETVSIPSGTEYELSAYFNYVPMIIPY